MKTHLSVFALSAILIVSIGMTPVFGQAQDPITVSTDAASYSDGDTIVVTGTVRDLFTGTPVALLVISPNGSVVTIKQLTVGDDKTFSVEIIASGTIKVSGEYTVTATYGENRSATTAFQFGGAATAPPSNENTGITDTTVAIEGTDDLIGYEITGGTLKSITPSLDDKSLIVSINAVNDGSLTLTIPRTILDALDANGEDADFFVVVDGEEFVEFNETKSSTTRTVTIPFAAGVEEIEIIGTFVVPEFGVIAAMILAVAIISIIAISSKSRLSIMPRY